MQVSLYIRKNVREQFKAEPHKSVLVNQLLARYYYNVEVEPDADEEVRPVQKAQAAD